jgi:hypothetical protein
MSALWHFVAGRLQRGASVQSVTCRTARFLRPVLLIAVWTAGSLVFADESLDRLVRLVGRDAGLCVEIPRLEETVGAFEQSEFFQRLQRSRIYSEWQSGGEYRHARGIVTVIEKFTGKSFRQFFHDMFGRAVVVAVYAEPGPKMSAIMLTETSSREALDGVIEGWNRAEPQQTDAIEFAGQSYYKRTCAAKEGTGTLTLFYCKLDRTLMLTDREELVRRSLTLSQAAGLDQSLLGLPTYQAARKSLQAGLAARAYVNPRAWDGVLGFSAATPTPPSTAGATSNSPDGRPADVGGGPPTTLTRTFQAAWRRCEWLAIGLQLDRGIVVEAVARYSLEGLSERDRNWIRAMSGPAEFLHMAPHDSLVVVAGRQAFGDLLKQMAPRNTRDPNDAIWDSLRQVSRGLLLGLDPFEDVLPAFRENWGAYLVPRKDAKSEELPLDGVIALELPHAAAAGPSRGGDASSTHTTSQTAGGGGPPTVPASGTASPSFRDALDNGLNIAFNLGAAYFNTRSTGKPAVVRTETAGPARTRWIDSLGPYQPAYSLTSRFLVFATSPQAIRGFIAREVSAPVGTIPPAIGILAKRYFPQENQVIYIDTAAIRRLLVEHGQQLIRHATRVRSIRSEDAKEALTNFLDVASLFDAVFAAGRVGEGEARLVLGGVIHAQAVAGSVGTAHGGEPADSSSGKPERAE